MTWKPHENVDTTRQIIALWCSSYDNLNSYNWAIEYERTIIGNVSVVTLNEKADWVDLGYCMGFAYWNKGIMSEAVREIIRYLFEEVNVNRVGIYHTVSNPASGEVAKKCGLTYEGIKRGYIKLHSGEYHDLIGYDITKKDWNSR